MLFRHKEQDLERVFDAAADAARASDIPDRCEIVNLPFSCGCNQVYCFGEGHETVQGYCPMHGLYFTFLGMAHC